MASSALTEKALPTARRAEVGNLGDANGVANAGYNYGVAFLAAQ
jgi:hypothetical protein